MGYIDITEYTDGSFDDLEDSVCADLENTNEDYKSLLHESSEMDAKYPFIWQALYGEGEITLTAAEHAILFEYLMMEKDIEAIERRAIYLRGHADARESF